MATLKWKSHRDMLRKRTVELHINVTTTMLNYKINVHVISSREKTATGPVMAVATSRLECIFWKHGRTSHVIICCSGVQLSFLQDSGNFQQIQNSGFAIRVKISGCYVVGSAHWCYVSSVTFCSLIRAIWESSISCTFSFNCKD